MTKDELLKKLNELAEEGDTEHNHRMADVAIIEYINDPDITKAYNEVDKWYA